MARKSQNGLDAHERVGGADDDGTQAGITQCEQRRGLRARSGRARKDDLLDNRLTAAPYEIVLEVEPALAGQQSRVHGLVAHGQHTCADAERPAQMRRDLTQGGASARRQLRSMCNARSRSPS